MNFIITEVNECKTSGIYEVTIQSLLDESYCEILAYDITTKKMGVADYSDSSFFNDRPSIVFEYNDGYNNQCLAISIPEYIEYTDYKDFIDDIDSEKFEKEFVSFII